MPASSACNHILWSGAFFHLCGTQLPVGSDFGPSFAGLRIFLGKCLLRLLNNILDIFFAVFPMGVVIVVLFLESMFVHFKFLEYE